MKAYTFKFIACPSTPLHIASARLSVSRWINRRAYPIRIIHITDREVLVELQAPTNAHHNRAVDALGKILQRQLDRRYALQSRLVPSYA